MTVHSTGRAPARDGARLRRIVLTLAVCASLVTACGVATGDEGSEERSSGTFSLAFARCMRAHGVPEFPDPDGQAGQLAPARSRADRLPTDTEKEHACSS